MLVFHFLDQSQSLLSIIFKTNSLVTINNVIVQKMLKPWNAEIVKSWKWQMNWAQDCLTKSHFRWHFRSQLFHRSSSSWFKIKHFLTKLLTLDCIDLKRRLAYPYFGQGIENFQTLNLRLLYIVPNHFLHPKWKHELTCIYLGSSKRPWRCSLTSQFLT